MKIKRVVVYIRVSSDEQVREGHSLETQERICFDYARRNKLEVLALFREEGENAKTMNRTSYNEMIIYCAKHQKEIDAVLVYKLDRMSRDNMSYYAEFKKALQNLGIKVISATEPIDDTPMGQLNEGLLVTLAQFDNAVRAERSKQGMVDAVRAGRWCWVAPIGYINGRVNGEKNILPDRDNPIRVSLVQEAWKLIDNGYSITEVTRILKDRGLTHRNGNPVTKQVLSKMFRSKLYIGIIEKFDMVVESDSIEALVDRELWWRVFNRLEGKKVSPNKHLVNNPEYPLKGLLMCCHGHVMTGSASKSSTGKYYPLYHCAKCDSKRPSYSAPKVHGEFSELVEELSLNEDHAEALKEAIRLNYAERYEAAMKKRKRLEKELSGVKGRKKGVIDKMINGALTDEQGKGYLAICEDEEQSISVQLAGLGTFESNVGEIWNFGVQILTNLGSTWENIKNLEIKQRFQRWIFPEGITYNGKNFGTSRIARSLTKKQPRKAAESLMVPPTGFEPAAPGLGNQCSIP